MLAILLHGMQGTPYIYQDEELGMTNVQYDIEDYRDIETLNVYKERLEKGYSEAEIMRSIHAKSRDNARTPMQWDNTRNAGFTEGKPWIKINPNYTVINAASQAEDEDSVFSCYRKLIQLRKEYPVFVDGDFQMLLEKDKDIFAYVREDADSKMLVICNFHDQWINCPIADMADGMKLKIGNYKTINQPEVLRPYEARLYMKCKDFSVSSSDTSWQSEKCN